MTELWGMFQRDSESSSLKQGHLLGDFSINRLPYLSGRLVDCWFTLFLTAGTPERRGKNVYRAISSLFRKLIYGREEEAEIHV